MNKTLAEIEKEIKELEEARQKENLNRINAFGPIFRIQDELGGSVFGITFAKNIHEFDNEAYDRVVSTLLEKMNNMAKLYENPDKYLDEYFKSGTYGISKDKFIEYSNEIRNSLKAIKVSNSKLDNIWNKEKELGKLKAVKLDDKNTKDSVPAIKVQIDDLKAEIVKLENDIQVNEVLMQNASSDGLKNVYANAIAETKKLIASKKASITKLYKIVSKEDVEYYEKMLEEEKQKEEERKAEEEKAKIEEEKQAKFAEAREKRKTEKINEELDKAEYGEEAKDVDTPQEALDGQLTADITPEKPSKPKLISRIGAKLKAIVDGKNAKAIAVLAASAALIAGGIILAPGAMISAAGATLGYLGYKEFKKGMGK